MAINKDYLNALNDILCSVKNYRAIFHMAWNELESKYKRSVLGPFWATLSIAVLVISLGILYSKLWKTEISDYLPYLTSGYIVWIFILMTLTDGTNLFINQEQILKQIKYPYFQLSIICIVRNLLVMAHHVIIFLFVALIFKIKVSWAILFFIPGLIILTFTLIWSVILLAMICARYRDMPMLVTNILSVAMFVTPILYKPETLGDNGQWVAQYNILFHYVEIVRKPMMGEYPSLLNWAITSITAIILALIVFYFFAKKRRSIIFWL